MDYTSYQFLNKLVNTHSPSGFEDEAAKIWKNYLEDSGIEVKTDVYRSCIAKLNKCFGPNIMMIAHIDEVGLMVHYINDNGYIYISEIGGLDRLMIPGQRVVIHNKEGKINGVIGRKAIHMLEDTDSIPELHEIYIDIGAKDKEDAEKIISVGDPITFDVYMQPLANGKIIARGFDDKIGAFCIAEIMKRLKDSATFKGTAFGVASVQEENTFCGAITNTYNIKPDVAVIIDVTHATDTPDVSKEKHGDVSLGDGPVVSVGAVVNRRARELLVSIAKTNEIPIQYDPIPNNSCTEADVIFRANGGIPCIVVSIPNRYMHTPVEMVHVDDLENVIKLITLWCEEINSISF